MSYRHAAISICIAIAALLFFSEQADASTFLLDDIVDADQVTETVPETVDQTTSIIQNQDTQNNSNQEPLSSVTGTVSNVADATEPVVNDVAEPVTESVEPVVETATEVVEPVVKTTAPVTQAVSDVAKPVAKTVNDVTEPVTQAVEPVVETVEPVIEAAEPVVEPVVEAVEPVVEPVVEAVDPVVDVVEPVTQPVLEPIVPAPAVEPVEPIIDVEPEQVVDIVTPPAAADPGPDVSDVVPVAPIEPAPGGIAPDVPVTEPVIEVPNVPAPPATDVPTSPAPPDFDVLHPVAMTPPVAPQVSDTITVPSMPMVEQLGAPSDVQPEPVVDAPSTSVDLTTMFDVPAAIPDVPVFTSHSAVSSVTSFAGALTEGNVISAPLRSAPQSNSLPFTNLGTSAPASSMSGGDVLGSPIAVSVALVLLFLLAWRARETLALAIPSTRYDAIPVPPG